MAAGTSPRRRAAAVLLLMGVSVALAGDPWRASAQVDLLSTTTTASSTTTTAPPESTTTTAGSSTTTSQPAPVLPPANSSSTTTTTAPGSPPPSQPAQPGPPGGGDNSQPPPDSVFPPELQALTNSVLRSRGNNTKKLVEALRPLTKFGVTESHAAVLGFGRFPVAGYASYVHDWWFPRFGPGWRLHEGTDIFAALGTPVRAPVDGHIRISSGGLGGLSVYVSQGDGTYWYMAHLSALPEGLHDGQAVKTGNVVGFVGDSGNARGGLPHLHFEIHPRGAGPIDPKEILDKFIADAVAQAPRLVKAYADYYASKAAAASATTPKRAAPPAPLVAPRAALLWASSVSPAGGALHLAEAEATRIAAGLDWEALAAEQQARRAARKQAEQFVRLLVAPLLPSQLAVVLG